MVSSYDNTGNLHNDLDKLVEWSEKWQMVFIFDNLKITLVTSERMCSLQDLLFSRLEKLFGLSANDCHLKGVLLDTLSLLIRVVQSSIRDPALFTMYTKSRRWR